MPTLKLHSNGLLHSNTVFFLFFFAKATGRTVRQIWINEYTGR